MSLHEFIVPLGILTYTALTLTILSGFLIFKFHVKWMNIRCHTTFAIITLISASFHAAIVLFISH